MESTITKFWQAARHMIDTFIDRLPALVVAIVVFVGFYFLSFFVARIIHRILGKHRQNLGAVFARLSSGATILLGLLVAFSIVAPPFQASDLVKILGIGGVAIGFAFQNILQNFLAGVLLLWSEPFRVGDEIKLDAFEGAVEEIQARATIIKTYDERRVVIPNADLFTRAVIVNTALDTRRWQYDLNLKGIQNLADLKTQVLNVVRKVPGVVSNPSPEVFVLDVDAGSDTAKVRVLWGTHDTSQHQMLASYDQVLTAIIAALNRPEAAPKQTRAA